MNIYLIALNKPNNEVWERLQDSHKRHYIFNKTLAFLSPSDRLTLTREIAETVGISPTGAAGMIFKIEA